MKVLLIFATVSLIFLSSSALAQNPDDYKKWEFFGGYSALWFDNLGGDTAIPAVDDILGGRNAMRGFEVAVTRNFHRYVGAKFDYSVHFREDNFTRPLGSGNIDSTLHNILGGVQFKDNVEDGPRFKPFGHILAGFAQQKVDVDSPQLPIIFGVDDFHANETSFAMAFGGGLDIRLTDRIDIRAGQIDWNIVARGDQQVGTFANGQPFVIPGNRQDNLRLSVGIVIH